MARARPCRRGSTSRPTGLATVVVVATDWPDDVPARCAGLRAASPAGTPIVVVADGPSAGAGGRRSRRPTETGSRSSGRASGSATRRALNIGIRRATGPVVILLDASVEPTGDIVTPLVAALDDPRWPSRAGSGIVSDDLRRFEDAPAGDVDAIEGYAIAFRRADCSGRGPLDEQFRFYRNLDIWWSLVLRDEGEGSRPRRAVAVDSPGDPPRAPRLDEPAGGGARPPEQAQLLPDHRPVRRPPGPAASG